MPKKFKPPLKSTPFQHSQYTLTRSQKQFNHVLQRKDLEFLSCGANAQVDFFDRESGGFYAIVQLGDVSKRTLLEVHALLLHEAVHIWQRVKLAMGEKDPSVEFEAYSIQRIALDLFDIYEQSEKLGGKHG